jgi:hypothetical protein
MLLERRPSATEDGDMSDFDQVSPTGGSSPGQRIGDPERQAVISALDAHREAGRLSAEEFEDREVTASQARTWADVQPLFRDLPAPYPAQMPAQPSPGQQLARTMQPNSTPSGGLLADIIPERYRTTVMALTPFVAVLLFFVTETWLWFLLIPVMGVLLYGPDGNRDAKRRDRDRRRNR